MKGRKMMRAKKGLVLGLVLSSSLLLAACSQESTEDAATATAEETADSAETQEVVADAPAPFGGEAVKIAVVQNSGAGDYFQQWTNGAQQQAAAVGIELNVYDAQADNAKQATDMETAIGSGVAGIIVDHGQADTMCPLIVKATDAGIPVVVYDIEITECAPDAVETAQSDADLANLVLTQMATDLGTDIPVGYVNVLGIAPLDRRNVVWEEFVKSNNWDQKFFVGKFTNAVATDNAQLADAALKANPDVVGIFAPYDELTKGVVSAIEQNNLQDSVSAYGLDISNADIEIMTKDGSPWKATSTTDPNAIGAGVVRAMALELAGELNNKEVEFPGVLITQQFLLDNGIANMEQLRAAMPELNLAESLSADWIPSVKF
jgi:simple sugar transport system substrate-binding protein|tara:strand:- start:1951 stop:3081 length:1131 start_codon:yes stop_codon:yes gene_type:complete